MNFGETPRTAQAGTVESMDCLVTISASGERRRIEISGGGVSRFRATMEQKVNQVLDGLGSSENIAVSVQDNGAIDIVLGARVEAAYLRFRGVTGA
jgi:citrate lyase subunit gamma (acyl carrier protein)